jgi:tetratricopeptide (TPR) repeat protein
MLEEKINNIANSLDSKNISNSELEAKKLLVQHPYNFDLNNILGIISVRLNKLDDALYYFNRCLDIRKDSYSTHYNLGIVYNKKYLIDKAINAYKESININPNHFESYFNLGNIFLEKQEFRKAIKNFEEAIKIQKDDFELLNNLGMAFEEIEENQKSIECLEKSILLNPQFFLAYNNLGLVFHKTKFYEKAYINYIKCLELKPDFVDALNNLGLLMQDLKRYDEAIKYFEKVLSLDSGYIKTYNNLGNIYADLGDFYKAKKYYKESLKIDSSYYESIHSLSYIELLEGSFAEGWGHYENRWFSKNYRDTIRYDLNKNLWDGQYLDGTLLIWSEQGLGDHIFFGRIVKFLSKLSKRIIFEVDYRLINIFKNFFIKEKINNIHVKSIDNHSSDNNFDKHIPLGSLAKFFIKTRDDLKNFSNDRFSADSNEKQKILNKLNQYKGLKIGLSWKTLNKDQDYRSARLEDLLPLLKLNNCSFFNLQFGDVNNEINSFNKKYDLNIHQFDDINNYNEIDKLCALIDSLDLVITIQNTTAHLSGAIGKKTFLLLSKNHRWHWGVNDKISYWYPSIRIFRQKFFNNWKDVVDDVLKEIVFNE